MEIQCKNCHHNFEGKFCNNCGQTAHTHKIDFKSTLHEIQHSIFHVDKGILYTTKELFLKPGAAIRDYLDGKRVQHFKPFAYVFILSTVYALITKLSHKSTFLTNFLEGMSAGTKDGKSKSSLILMGDAAHWMANHYAYTALLIIPFLSFASYICFRKEKYNYFQHLVLNAFVAGQRTAVFLIFLPFTYFIRDPELNESFDTFKAYVGIFLSFWIYYKFFNKTHPLFRILLTLLTFLILVAIVLFVIILAAITSKVLMP